MISTLEGSSGAPVFLNGQIIGVHKGCIEFNRKKIAYTQKTTSFYGGLMIEEQNDLECSFAKNDLHSYEIFSTKIYQNILQGISLYSMSESQRLRLHLSFLSAKLRGIEKAVLTSS